jgi:hypothetical protein
MIVDGCDAVVVLGSDRPNTGAFAEKRANMNLQLSDEQAAALERELRDLIDADRYFLSPRVRTLREILNKIRPESVGFRYR